MQSPKDALAKAIRISGGASAMARTLGLRGHQVVYQWSINRVPTDYCPTIERLTGVRCEDLRPDVEWGVLRGVAPAQSAQDATEAVAQGVAGV